MTGLQIINEKFKLKDRINSATELWNNIVNEKCNKYGCSYCISCSANQQEDTISKLELEYDYFDEILKQKKDGKKINT